MAHLAKPALTNLAAYNTFTTEQYLLILCACVVPPTREFCLSLSRAALSLLLGAACWGY